MPPPEPDPFPGEPSTPQHTVAAPYRRLHLLAAGAALLLLGHVDPHVGVGGVEPPRLLLLLLLGVLPQGGDRGGLLLEDEGRHRGGDQHVAFGLALLLHEGVAVGVAGAVTLERQRALGRE